MWVRKVLISAFDIVKLLKQENWVIIQGAGPDYVFTDSVLCCLVELIIDPYYRTAEGFCTLLRKDFFVEGYVFIFSSDSFRLVSSPFGVSSLDVTRSAARGSFRYGPLQSPVTFPAKSKKDSDRDHWPFFFLLIHSAQELLLRFPSFFGFTEEFLILLLDTFSVSHVCCSSIATNKPLRLLLFVVQRAEMQNSARIGSPICNSTR